MSTGSLGQGSRGKWYGAGNRLNQSKYHTYVILGDGEIQEGQVWEAMTSAHYRWIILLLFDYNGLQIDGWIRDVKVTATLAGKWRAFGWHVMEVDGTITQRCSKP